MGAEIFGKTRRHIRFLKRKRVELFGFLAHNGVNIFCPANHGVNLFGQGVSTYSVRGVSIYSVGGCQLIRSDASSFQSLLSDTSFRHETRVVALFEPKV